MAEPVRTRPRRRGMRAVLAGWIAAITLTACSGGGQAPSAAPGSSAAPADANRTLVIGATAEPTSLDPTADAAAAGSQALLYNVYETLVKVDAEGNLKPLLAQSWDVSDDRLTYTFLLNRQARFSDGSPVDAEAVAANIERIRTQPVASKLKAVMAVVASTDAVDATTLKVTLARPSVNWLFDMASTAGMVMNPAGFADARTKTAGSGPLEVAGWTQGDSIRLVRASYWGTPVRFDEVTFRYFRDPNAMNAAMLAGDLDVISNLQAPDALGQFGDTVRFTVVEGTTNGEVVLGINNGAQPTTPGVTPGNGNPALKDVRVRQAITLAIDKRALVETTWFGKGTPLGSMAVPTDPYYEDLTGLYPYDPERARALLAEAGHPRLTLRLRPAALPYASRAAQFIASQLGQVGITVQVEEMQFPARWLDVVYNKADYDLTIVSHVEARDLTTYANPDYYWRYANPAFTEQVRAADAGTVEEYTDGMRAAARLLADDAAGVWLYALPNLVVTRAGVTGVPRNATTLSFDVTTMASA